MQKREAISSDAMLLTVTLLQISGDRVKTKESDEFLEYHPPPE